MFLYEELEANSIEQLYEQAEPWNLILRKLNKGSEFHSTVRKLISHELILIEARFGGILDQRGAAPLGFRTIWIPINEEQNFVWRKHQIDGESIGIFPRGGELHSTSHPGFAVFVFSIPEDFLAERAELLGYDWFATLGKEGAPEHFRLSQEQVIQLRYFLFKILKVSAETFDIGLLARSIRELKTQFVDRFVSNCFQSLDENNRQQDNRDRIFTSFQELVLANPKENLSIKSICREIGTSERALQYALKSKTDLTPVQYSKALKLNLVREQLKTQFNDKTTIREVANCHGFWHLGQFSSDYKSHFGELPSETVNECQVPLIKR